MKWLAAIVCFILSGTLEVAALFGMYSLWFEPCPPTHGEGPVFYMAITVMLGGFLLAFIFGAPLIAIVGVKIMKEC